MTVNGERPKVKGERFSVSLPIDIGRNKLRVVARVPSFEDAKDVVQITRTEPPPVAATSTEPTETGAAPAPDNSGFDDPPDSSREYYEDQIDAARERGDIPDATGGCPPEKSRISTERASRTTSSRTVRDRTRAAPIA